MPRWYTDIMLSKLQKTVKDLSRAKAGCRYLAKNAGLRSRDNPNAGKVANYVNNRLAHLERVAWNTVPGAITFSFGAVLIGLGLHGQQPQDIRILSIGGIWLCVVFAIVFWGLFAAILATRYQIVLRGALRASRSLNIRIFPF